MRFVQLLANSVVGCLKFVVFRVSSFANELQDYIIIHVNASVCSICDYFYYLHQRISRYLIIVCEIEAINPIFTIEYNLLAES